MKSIVLNEGKFYVYESIDNITHKYSLDLSTFIELQNNLHDSDYMDDWTRDFVFTACKKHLAYVYCPYDSTPWFLNEPLLKDLAAHMPLKDQPTESLKTDVDFSLIQWR